MVQSQFHEVAAQLHKQLACLVLEHEREVSQLQNIILQLHESSDTQEFAEDSPLAALKKTLQLSPQLVSSVLDSSRRERERERGRESLGRESTSNSWETNFGGQSNTCRHPTEQYAEEVPDVAEEVPDVAVHKKFKIRELWTEPPSLDISISLEVQDKGEFNIGPGKTRHSVGFSFVRNPAHKLVNASLVTLRPGSTVRICWDLLSVMGLGFDIILVPLQMAALVSYGNISMGLDWFSRIFWSLDIFVSCVTGYYSKGNLIMDWSQIAKHYCRTWLLFDLLAVGTDWSLFFTTSDSRVSRLTRIGKYLRFVRTLANFRMQRSAIRHSAELLDQMFSDAARARFAIFKWLLFVLLVYHFIACWWYTLGMRCQAKGLPSWVDMFTRSDDVEYRYITSLQWTMSYFAGVSGGVVPRNFDERLFCLVMALLSLFALSSIVSVISSTIQSMQAESSHETLQLNMLGRFLRIHDLPAELCERVRKNAMHRSQVLRSHIYPQDVELLGLVSDTLRMEVMYSVWEPCLRQSNVFAPLCSSDKPVVQLIAQEAVQLKVLAAQDYAFHSNEEAESSLYIICGNLSYTPNMTVIGHHIANCTFARAISVSADMHKWICEITLWAPWMHVGDLVSSSDSDIACVVTSAFSNILKTHPDVFLPLSKQASEFVDTMNEVLKSDGRTMLATFDLFGAPSCGTHLEI